MGAEVGGRSTSAVEARRVLGMRVDGTSYEHAATEILRWAGPTAGGDWAVSLPVLALIAMILGPVLAVFGAKRVADRRGAALDAAAVGTVLITGLVTAGLLWSVLRGPA